MRLGDICKFQSGGTPSKNESAYFNGNIPWITTVALNGDYITDSDAVDWITEKAIKESAAKIVPENSIMVGTRVGVGKVGINKIPMSTSQDIISLLGINECEWYKPYLCKYLQSKSAFLNSQARGATIKGIKIDVLASLEISELSIEEQKNISFLFDTLTSLISLRKQQLSKLDELIKSRFIELFIGKGYPTRTIDEVSLGKGEYGAQSASTEYDPSRPRYVRITDINDDGTLNDDVVSSINPTDDEQYRLEYGDFMFARMGATVGKTYAFIEGNQIFAGYLIRYRLNRELINPRYLFWYTKLDEYWNWVKMNQSGAAQPGINAKKYGSLQIPLPSIQQQNQFATFVEQVDKSKSEIQKSLEKLETLKKALMQKYFG